jgi:hypothetical protein
MNFWSAREDQTRQHGQTFLRSTSSSSAIGGRLFGPTKPTRMHLVEWNRTPIARLTPQTASEQCTQTEMPMRSVIRFLSAAVLMAAWHSSITAVNAQNAQQTSPGLSALGPSVPTPAITDQKLDAVAAAFQKVSTVQGGVSAPFRHSGDAIRSDTYRGRSQSGRVQSCRRPGTLTRGIHFHRGGRARRS